MTSSRYFKWNVLCYVKMLRLLWYGSGKSTRLLLCLHFLFTSKYHLLLEGPPEVHLTQEEIKKAGFWAGGSFLAPHTFPQKSPQLMLIFFKGIFPFDVYNKTLKINDLKNQWPSYSENTHQVNRITENEREVFLESYSPSSLYDSRMKGTWCGSMEGGGCHRYSEQGLWLRYIHHSIN